MADLSRIIIKKNVSKMEVDSMQRFSGLRKMA
ncbi:hypothetical protein GA0116948_105226 [Chitinophaga costaii]|uniref:Uncharacterized protein n=1 Tax=Chitinophaga costaii TaxID=1335309 RepID=A0A1C4DE88_9BACT|nr:hypothetical protein GA0116948_105226 [Chitinophaga costaii]